MIIRIKTEGKRFFIPLPVMWAFGPFGLKLMKKYDKSGAFDGVSAKSMRNIKKAIRRAKRTHRGWAFIEVESADGTYVKIKI